MMHETIRRVVLQLNLIPGVGPQAIKKILDSSGLERLLDIYLLSVHDIMVRFSLPQTQAEKIVSGLQDKRLLEQEEALLEKHAIRFITCVDDNYPEILHHIHAPPAVLYLQGDELPDGSRSVACVGSRDADSYGQSIVRLFIPELVRMGFATISGGARGIDGMVHQATLDAQGATVAVVGSGLLNLYPHEHKTLFTRIAHERGTLVSSFPLRAAPQAHNFPARNRIIAGLSRSTLVMQAAVKSGALITAHYALQEGRSVAAVPGAITHPLSAGCHALIAQGAALISTVESLHEFLGERPSVGYKQTRIDEQATEKDPLVQACQQARSLEDLLMHSGLPYLELQERLWQLQADGLLDQTAIGLWQAQ